MNKFALIIAAILVTGCIATTAKYEEILGGWVGSSEGSLVAAWGVPDGAYEAGNIKFISYMKSKSGYVPGTPPRTTSTVIGNEIYTTQSGGTQGHSYSHTCKTTFQIQQGYVSGWSYDGNWCLAK